MLSNQKMAAFIAAELFLLVTPMMWPTLPFPIVVAFYAVAVALVIYAVWPLITSRPWWRNVWLFVRYPHIRVTFADWLNLTSRKEMARSVGDRVIWTESEYRVTGFDFAARNASSGRLTNFSGQVQSLETGKSFPILIDAMPPDQTYGVPSRAPFRINVRFPRSNARTGRLDD